MHTEFSFTNFHQKNDTCTNVFTGHPIKIKLKLLTLSAMAKKVYNVGPKFSRNSVDNRVSLLATPASKSAIKAFKMPDLTPSSEGLVAANNDKRDRVTSSLDTALGLKTQYFRQCSVKARFKNNG